MKLRTIALLAIALFAAAALTVPAASSATTILDGGNKLNDKEIPIEGTHVIQNKGVGSISCTHRLTMTVKDDTVTISKYEILTNTCTFTGRFTGCTINKYTPEDLAWKVDVDKAPAAALTIKDMTVSIEFAGKDCPYTSMKFTYEPMTGVPDDPKKVSSFKFSGKPDVKLVPKESGYPESVKGTEVTTEENALTAFGGTGRCPGTSFDGELKEHSSSLTLTPTFAKCTVIMGESAFSSTAFANGCTFVVHVGSGSGDTWAGTLDFSCPEGKALEFALYSTSTHTLKLCTIKLEPQKALSGLTIEDKTESGDLRIHGKVTGILAKQSGLCGAKETKEAAYDLDLTGAGSGAEGPEGIHVNGGLFTAEEAEVDAEGEGEGENSVEEAGTYEIG